jgi:hypothetical protein
MRLRITYDQLPSYVAWVDDYDALVQCFGTESWYHPTANGWLIYHPLDREHYIRAEWSDE